MVIDTLDALLEHAERHRTPDCTCSTCAPMHAIVELLGSPLPCGWPKPELNEQNGRVTNDAIAALAEWLELVPDRSPDAWVFPADEVWSRNDRDTSRARPLAETTCKMALTRAAERAKLADVTWHTLRHTFASQLVMRGGPLRAVQELLGHASIKMTERYAHLAPGFANRQLVAVLDTPLVLPSSSAGPMDTRPTKASKADRSQRAAKAPRRPRRTPRKDS